MSLRPTRIAVLVSGRGSNLRALLEARAAEKLPMAHFRVVISNNPDAPALEIAKSQGIEAVAVDHRRFKGDRSGHEAEIVRVLREHEVELVVLAGYMRLLTPTLLEPYMHRMINIHPSLLPAFPGVDAQSQAVAYGVKYSGCTVHFVSEEMDAGPIITQRIVPLHPGETSGTLSARILVEEHRALAYAVDVYTRGRLQVEGRQVSVLPGETSFPELEGRLQGTASVLVATGNQHKLDEIRHILQEVSLEFRSTAQFPGWEEPEENASDYLGNARIKAAAWQERTGLWTLADDSGLEVEALGWKPGIHSSRYAPTTAERNAKLLEELRDVPPENRRARFCCTVVVCGGSGREYHATGVCEGRIALEPRGEHGFGYDPLFIPDGFGGKHLAELPESVKNNISHRARALFALKPTLEKLARGLL